MACHLLLGGLVTGLIVPAVGVVAAASWGDHVVPSLIKAVAGMQKKWYKLLSGSE